MIFKDDKSLLHCFLRGDEKGFIAIYDRYWDALFLSCYRRIKEKAAAEELVQTLFLELWQKRHTLQIGQVENYLFSSLRQSTIDFLNKKMVAGKYLEFQNSFKVRESNAAEEIVKLNNLEERLEKGLPGKSKPAFRLHRWPVDKILPRVVSSKKTVHYHLTRSLKFSRTYLREFTLALFVLLFRH